MQLAVGFIYLFDANMDKASRQSDFATNGTFDNRSLSGELNSTLDYTDDGPITDEDEYVQQRNAKWQRIARIYNTTQTANFYIAAILACLSIVVLVTMRNSKLREKSAMWYLYHLIAIVVGFFVLHPIAVFGNIYKNQSTCLFVIYSFEYLFMAFSLSVILANTEIFFTVILPLRYWRTRHFIRFMVSILGGWIVVCLIVGHLIIDNNDARRDGNHCYYSKSKNIRNIRFALRSVLPASAGFLFTCTSIVIYVLKRYRSTKMNSFESLKEILVSEKDEVNWVRATACLNLFALLRMVSRALMNLSSIYVHLDKNVYAVVILFTVHVQSLYLPPVAMLLLPEVREDLKRMCMTVLFFFTRGRVGSRDKREPLEVSFGNINATDE